ncbi:hypothetical protein CYMTET_49538 [Cymbomonas tetramitiformis]|uniref:Uncharacterized protein n=1 Tax=Cymbomonas tetramitiformis TaxID=36881 RepID=A0AAE0EU15_9CHLO|nr:hypothetical protein CYMTET_49538 [Cymbomonas tetramitiformis]
MSELREGLYQSWVAHGQNRPLFELIKLEAKRPTKFYPVDDDLGGGAVFSDNASAQECLHLGEGMKMLRCADTKELGLAAIDAPGSRRSPLPSPQRRSPPPQHMAATATGAGTSSAGAGPSGTKSPVREALAGGALARTWPPRGCDRHSNSWSSAFAHLKQSWSKYVMLVWHTGQSILTRIWWTRKHWIDVCIDHGSRRVAFPSLLVMGGHPLGIALGRSLHSLLAEALKPQAAPLPHVRCAVQ